MRDKAYLQTDINSSQATDVYDPYRRYDYDYAGAAARGYDDYAGHYERYAGVFDRDGNWIDKR